MLVQIICSEFGPFSVAMRWADALRASTCKNKSVICWFRTKTVKYIHDRWVQWCFRRTSQNSGFPRQSWIHHSDVSVSHFRAPNCFHDVFPKSGATAKPNACTPITIPKIIYIFFATLLFPCIRLFWERNNVQTKLIFDQVQELMMQWLCKHVSWILVVGTPLWSANFALNKTFKLTWTQSTAGRIEKELENTNAGKTIKTTTTPTATTTTHHIKHTQKKNVANKTKVLKTFETLVLVLGKKGNKELLQPQIVFPGAKHRVVQIGCFLFEQFVSGEEI